MVREKAVYECSHPDFSSCSFTSDVKAVVQYHERRHEMDALIDQISEVHDHKHFVQKEVIGFLDDWLEHGEMAGLVECQSCSSEVHSLLDQCPECYSPVHELQKGATLKCGECDSDRILVMRKGDQRRKQGFRCADCGAYVAHGNGIINPFNHTENEDMGYWEEADD